MLEQKLTGSSIEDTAKQLLGQTLVRRIDTNDELSGRIVEVECYQQDDPASHTFNGKTNRNQVMFGPAGFAYVYFTYGMHYCFNVTVGAEGEGAAVLIRALEPIEGLETMRTNRDKTDVVDLCSGPAKLCQALDIDTEFSGHDLSQYPLRLKLDAPGVKDENIVTTTRVGISKAVDKPWRFYIAGSGFVSKP